MDNKNNNNNQQLNIEVPETVATGVYSNLVIVGHSPAEFVLDFVQILPGLQKGLVRSRVIMSPIHAKRLMLAMEENVAKYEASFGKIEIHEANPGNVPPTFGGPAGFA